MSLSLWFIDELRKKYIRTQPDHSDLIFFFLWRHSVINSQNNNIIIITTIKQIAVRESGGVTLYPLEVQI